MSNFNLVMNYTCILQTSRACRTQFEVSSFSSSEDVVGGTKNLNRSRDHNHAHFGGDFYSFAKT